TMSLQQRLNEFKAAFESGGPPMHAPRSIIETIHRATEELRRSGLAERALKAGAAFPSFTLNNQNGNSVSSAKLLEKGTLVVTVFRGHW
ncbi:MAG: peroxiredoxin-like family protein, partial [Candidatus Acidiferrum sp.]